MTIATVTMDFAGATQDQSGDVFGITVTIEKAEAKTTRRIAFGAAGARLERGIPQGTKNGMELLNHVTPDIARSAVRMVDPPLAGAIYSEGLRNGCAISFRLTWPRRTISI